MMILRLDDGKAGDQLKVASVQRENAVAKMQRSRADEKIFERDADAPRCLFALHSARELSDFECKWVNSHISLFAR
jgi:hypothetical protein